MTQAIRLSPSGPNISNANGGELTPGTGMMLRLAEASTTLNGAGQIPTAPTVLGTTLGSSQGLGLALNNPDPNLNYRASVLCEVANGSTNVPGEVQLFLETSVDGGTSWTEQVSNTHTVNSTEVAPGVTLARLIRLDMTQRLGSGLGVTAATKASGSLQVRARIGATSGGGVVSVVSAVTPGGDTQSVGTTYSSLSEHF